MAGCENSNIDKNISLEQTDNSHGEASATREIFAMDTYMTITAYGQQAEQAVDKAVLEINRLEGLISTGIETSEIAQINQRSKGKISEDNAYLVERSIEIFKDTKGAFDITIYPVMKLWGFTTGNYKVPEKKDIVQEKKLISTDNLVYDKERSNISFLKKGMAIDLGGIAKGYTSVKIMEIFQDYRVKSAVVNLGGNVQVLGRKSNGDKWRVAIENPDQKENYLGVLELENKAVITSGGYERYFEENGITYHHIIDPKTGYPAKNGLISVTVVSDDGTLADGLSTALFVMGKENAIEYWKEHQKEFQAILVDDENEIYITEGIEQDFTTDKEVKVIAKK